MRLYKNAVILLVVLGLLAGAYALLKDKKKTPEPFDSAKSGSVKILDQDTSKMTEISIKSKEGQFVFANKDKQWIVVSPAGLNADSSVIENIANSLASLSAEKVVEENAADVGKFGFNSASEVSVKLTEGPDKTIEVGDKTPTKEAYYVKEKGSSKVYTVSNSTIEKILIKKDGLKKKSLFSFKPEELIGFSMEKEGKLFYKAKKLEDSSWALTYPVETKAEITNLGQILQNVTDLKVANFIEEKAADLDKYGLKTPGYGFEVETSGMKTKVLIGIEKERGTEIFAKLDNSSEVFTLDEKVLNFIDKPVKEVMMPFAYLVDIQDVSRIEVDMDGVKTVSEIQTDKENTDKDVFTVNGKDVSALKDDKNNSYFRNYYQALIGITISDLESGAVPSGKSEITIAYSLKKAPGTMKVEYIPKDNSTYYVVKNGKYSGITVAKKKFDETDGVRESSKALLQAISK